MNFSTFDLNLLRVLDALLREGSTVKAGDRLGLSQPAVSGSLARLRYALDDSLFIRKGQGLVPTDFARSLERPLRQQLDQLEAMLAGPKAFDPSSATQVFRIAGSDFFAEMMMPQLAAALHGLAPGIRVQLVDLVPSSYIDSLDRYEADIALIPDSEFPDWVEREPLFLSSFVVIARNNHPEIAKLGVPAGEVLPLDLFCSLGHVLFSPEGNLRAMGDAALARLGRQRRVTMTMPVFSGVCRAVSESDLVALVPRQLAEKLAPGFGLSIYSAPMPVEPGLIVGVWHKRATSNPAHRWLRNLVASILAPLNHGETRLPA